MDLTQIAAKLFLDKVGSGNLDLSNVTGALKNLLPTNGGEIDIAGLVSQFTSSGGGVAALATSWLSDGDNESISPSNIMDVFGDGKVNQFADTLGISTDQAAGGLSSVIPDLIDKSSEGGSLVKGLSVSLGKKLLGGLF